MARALSTSTRLWLYPTGSVKREMKASAKTPVVPRIRPSIASVKSATSQRSVKLSGSATTRRAAARAAPLIVDVTQGTHCWMGVGGGGGGRGGVGWGGVGG